MVALRGTYKGLWGFPEKFTKSEERSAEPMDKITGLAASHGVAEGTARLHTTPQEGALLGAHIAERANAACGPVAVLLPLRGLSLLDVEGQPFWWPEADAALFGTIREGLRPDIPLIEMDTEINDPAFARRAAETLLELL